MHRCLDALEVLFIFSLAHYNYAHLSINKTHLKIVHLASECVNCTRDESQWMSQCLRIVYVNLWAIEMHFFYFKQLERKKNSAPSTVNNHIWWHQRWNMRKKKEITDDSIQIESWNPCVLNDVEKRQKPRNKKWCGDV